MTRRAMMGGIGLVLLAATALPAEAFEVHPFTGMGPQEDLANGIHLTWAYPFGSYLVLTTEEGFHLYDGEDGTWIDRTWPGWIGRALYTVVPAGSDAQRLAMGGVNAFFKGTLRLSEDLGETDTLVYESTGGHVSDMAVSSFDSYVIFACTISDIAPGELLRSDDHGATYKLLTGHGQFAMTGVEALTDQEIYVAGDNAVSSSLDGGQTWENLQGDLPAGLLIHDLLAPQPVTALPDAPRAGGKEKTDIYASFLMIATDQGVYWTSPVETDWRQILPEACVAVTYRFVQLDTFVYWSEYYAVTTDGRLLANLNGNWENWQDVTGMIAPAVPIDVVCNLGPVYVATREHGVYVTSGIDGASDVPAAQGLQLSARPNPFNPVTELVFTAPAPGLARLTVYDLAGRQVAEVFRAEVTAGAHTVTWQPRRLASGTYHAVLEMAGKRTSLPISLVK